MNCTEVQSRLSEYHDNILDAATNENIIDHLSACERCRAEADNLAQTMKLVRVLPEVEPPANFTTRVMAHAREQAMKPSAWERLFFPFRLKLPIHAAAIILVSILAVYVYQKEPQQQKLEMVQSERFRKDQGERNGPPAEPRETIPTKESLESARQNEATSSSVNEQAPESSRAPQQLGEDKKEDVTTHRPASSIPAGSPDQVGLQSSSPAAAPLNLPEDTSAPPSGIVTGKNLPTPAMEAQGKVVSAPAPSGGTTQSKRGVGAVIPGSVAKKESSRAALDSPGASEQASDRLAAPQRQLAPKSERAKEPTTDYELVLRLRPAAAEDAGLADRLEPLQAQTAAAPALSREQKSALDQARQRATQTGQAQAIWLSIPRTQLEQVKRELAAIAQIESESAAGTREKDEVAKSLGPLRLKITILPARFESPVPTQR